MNIGENVRMLEQRMERMTGKVFETREELEAEGWEYVLIYALDLFLFKKGNRRIVWNSTTKRIEKEYEYIDQKLTSPE